MPNVIKYSTGATPSGSLRKGNMLIGNNTADYGATFFNGINPPSGGYTIYLNKASGGPSIYCPANNTQLIGITNQIAGANYTTAAQCLDYFASQTDKIIVNMNYEGIVTNGLVLNVDAGFLPSYPTTSSTWYDISGNSNNGTLTNGPTFSSDNSGSIVFDGVDDYSNNINFTNANTSSGTICGWVYPDSNGNNNQSIINIGGTFTYGGTRLIRIYSNKWSFATYGSSTEDWNFINDVTFNTWSYVVGVWSGTSLNFYLNTVGYSATRTGVVTPVGSVFRVGISAWDINDRPFKGKISSVQIYNRALTQTEILQNYYAMLNTRIIVTDSLVLNLQAGNLNSYPGSGSVWNDVSGYGSNMTLLNGPTFNSADGGYITFDNTDDFGFINVTSGNLLGNVNISMELWIKNPVGNFLMNGIYGSYFSSGFYSGGLLKNSNGNNGPAWTGTSTWQQWVAVWDQTNNQTRLYVNGTLVGTSSNTVWSPGTGGKLVFGGAAGNGPYSKEGSMDISIYRFYNKVLTQSEITQNYNANKTQFGL